MKKILFLFLMIAGGAGAQTNFVWEITDSVPKTKAQIYSDTKLFIAETWKSAKDVIQNDDKDAGVILVKGMSIQNSSFLMNPHSYTYSYSVKFLMKENRYKMVIENVTCTEATCQGNTWPLVPASDNTTDKIGSMPTAKRIEMMASLRKDLQSIADSYTKQIKKASGDW